MRIAHVVCGTVLLISAAVIRTTADGSWELVALMVTGIVLVLVSMVEPTQERRR